MSLVVPDLGEIELLRALLITGSPPVNFGTLRLFKNDWTPNKVSVLADVVECDFAGYAYKFLERAKWQGPNGIGGTAVSFYDTGLQQFTCSSGSQIVYGYYVLMTGISQLIWAERFATPFTVSTSRPLFIQPFMRLRSEVQPDPPP